VFLSLVLVLLFSFVMTTLEAARIRGATAYFSMISDMAGDSVLASYYYPLFQNYRIFGVDAGDEEGFFTQRDIGEKLNENIIYGTLGLSGGLLKFQDSGVEDLECETLMSGGCEAFYAQIKQQIVLDGVSLGLDGLFSKEQFTEAGVVGEIYRKQEEALAVTATVTEELLKLMELVDGISMGSDGIAFDENGRMQVQESFVKQPVSMTKTELQSCFDNEEVFQAISDSFYRADTEAEYIEVLLLNIQWLNDRLDLADRNITNYKLRLKELEKEHKAEKIRLETEDASEKTLLLELEKCIQETQGLLAAEEETKAEYETGRDSSLLTAKDKYKKLRETLDEVLDKIKDALEVTERLEKKQLTAKLSVEIYENFLEGMKEKLSEELYQAFLKELDKMKIYAGLDDRGFSLRLIKQSLENDKKLLEDFSLPQFSEYRLSEMKTSVSVVKEQMREYTVEGLWFSYGEIVVAEQTLQNVTGFLSELLTTGILSLVGISEEEQSERSLSGIDLPSEVLEEESLLDELMACMEEVRSLFQNGGFGDVLSAAGNSFLDGTALELYSMKYFHCYGESTPYTRLNYEREYLIFGKEEDKSNLLYMVLYLVAIRTLLNMVMILKQPDRMLQLDTLSTGIAGFTGIPVLVAVIKYSVLLLWSVEEALVDVAALLQGKRIAVMGSGQVCLDELLFMNRMTIERKANRYLEGVGAAYSDYLALVSLTKRTKVKTYRALDLIQENLRLRYRDSFRIRNVVTEISYETVTKVKPMLDVGVFPRASYRLRKEKKAAY